MPIAVTEFTGLQTVEYYQLGKAMGDFQNVNSTQDIRCLAVPRMSRSTTNGLVAIVLMAIAPTHSLADGFGVEMLRSSEFRREIDLVKKYFRRRNS